MLIIEVHGLFHLLLLYSFSYKLYEYIKEFGFGWT